MENIGFLYDLAHGPWSGPWPGSMARPMALSLGPSPWARMRALGVAWRSRGRPAGWGMPGYSNLRAGPKWKFGPSQNERLGACRN